MIGLDYLEVQARLRAAAADGVGEEPAGRPRDHVPEDGPAPRRVAGTTGLVGRLLGRLVPLSRGQTQRKTAADIGRVEG